MTGKSSQMYNSATWGGSTLSQISHCTSVRWLHIIPVVSLLLTGLTLHHSICTTASHWGNCVILGFKYWVTSVDPCHPMCLTAVNMCGSGHSMYATAAHCGNPSCPTFVYFCCSSSSCVFRICSLKWFCIITCFSLLLTGVAQFSFRFHSDTGLAGSVLFQVFYCTSLERLGVISNVLLPFTVMVLCHPVFLTATHRYGFLWSQMSQGRFLG